jgi:small subunit ribosomal protein S20
MPIIKSAKKRVRIAAKASVRNSRTKRSLREAIKDFYAALTSGKTDKISEAHRQAVSTIDVAVKKNIIHKNKAARKKHQLSEALKKANIKLPATKKAPVKTKTTAKPVAAKKIPAKKPVAKKTVTKTPAKKTVK